MGTFASSEDPDEMPKNLAFHQGLHCLPRQNLWHFIRVCTVCQDKIFGISSGSALFATTKSLAFHQGLHCLPRQNLSSKKYFIFLGNNNLLPPIYTIDHPDFHCLKLYGKLDWSRKG